MDQDEFVETSDAEELEEIQAKREYWQIAARELDTYRRDDGHSPRKRVKVSHTDYLQSKLLYI
jgi:hypothetical protein